MKTVILNCLCVGSGGFLGAVLRYLLGLLSVFNPTGFPLVTFFINASGSFLIAFFLGLFGNNLTGNPQLILFLTVGLCGGYTTFSTFSLESLQLLQKGDILLAVLYMVLSCAVCVCAALLGHMAATAMHPQ